MNLKTIVKPFLFPALIAGIGLLSSCSSDDGSNEMPQTPEGPTEINDGKIIPVPGDNSNFDYLYDFFNKELPFISAAEHDTAFLLGDPSDTCYPVPYHHPEDHVRTPCIRCRR